MPFVSYHDITERIMNYGERCFEECLDAGIEDYPDYYNFVHDVIEDCFNSGRGFVADFETYHDVSQISIYVTVMMLNFITRIHQDNEWDAFEFDDPDQIINRFAYLYINAHTPDYEERFDEASVKHISN